MLQRLAFCLLFIGLLWSSPLLAAEESDGHSRSALLSLQDGSQIRGQLKPSQKSGVVRWQIDECVRPFDFPVAGLVSVIFPAPTEREPMDGEFSFELHSGDVVAGEITAWSEGRLTLQSPQFGELTLSEEAIRRIDRIDDQSGLIYSGLTGTSDFRTVQGAWNFDGMRLVTSEPGARILGDFELPDRVMIEFTVSREKNAEFNLMLAGDPRAKQNSSLGWSCAVWGDSLALVHEQDDFAAVMPVATLSETDTVQLIAFLAQTDGLLHLYERTGKPLASLQLPVSQRPGSDELATGLGLELSDEGTVRLEQLAVSHWNGVLPAAQLSAIRQFHLNDGTTIAGPAESFTHADGTITHSQDDQTTSFSLRDVKRAVFAGEPSREPRQMVVLMNDQSRVSGELVAASDQSLTLRCPDVSDPMTVSLNRVRTLFNASGQNSDSRPTAEELLGTLHVNSGNLKGRLVETTQGEDGSCLVWHPQLSESPAPLKPQISGRIVYREPVEPKPETTIEVEEVQQPDQNALQKFGKLFFENLGRGRARRPRKAEEPQPHDIHLITGDVIPCEIESISPRGVHFSSKMTDTELIAHEHLRAVVFDRLADVPELEKARRERLLTLPRNQKASPPTHLLCSPDGDFLRCRLNALDGDAIFVEIQLSDHEIPASRVSHIIWMHPESSLGKDAAEQNKADDEAAKEQVDSPAVADLVQARMAKDNRSTFVPVKVENGELVGTSAVFGACRVSLSRIDQLFLGTAVVSAAGELPYHDWKLQPAAEPRFTQGGGDGPGTASPGMASGLVDKPAPDFHLPLLDGDEFVLSENRDQIILLDFWATWCGPCMLTMPLLEQAMEEFEGQPVRLISVNLEERPEQIRDVRERHQLSMTVALDRDGAIARRYNVESIPQLIIVDRQGTVHRHFIGGGQETVNEAARAVRALLADEANEQ